MLIHTHRRRLSVRLGLTLAVVACELLFHSMALSAVTFPKRGKQSASAKAFSPRPWLPDNDIGGWWPYDRHHRHWPGSPCYCSQCHLPTVKAMSIFVVQDDLVEEFIGMCRELVQTAYQGRVSGPFAAILLILLPTA
jgi:hypothetical protein